MSKTILVTGGIRSGKSHFAQELAERAGDRVLYVATAEARDKEMKARIEKHKKARPAGWRTLEAASGLAAKIKAQLKNCDVVLIDCLNMLVANILDKHVSQDDKEQTNYQEAEKDLSQEIENLKNCITVSSLTFIIVSNETGMGMVSLSKLGRYYQDLLGIVNQQLARISDEVYFIVSGIPLKIKP